MTPPNDQHGKPMIWAPGQDQIGNWITQAAWEQRVYEILQKVDPPPFYIQSCNG